MEKAYFTYRGKSSLDYGLRIHNRLEMVIPKKAFSLHQVAGSNGLIVNDLGHYEPIERTFICTLEPKNGKSPESYIEGIRAWLLGGKGFLPLSFSKDKGVYYRAFISDLIRIDTSTSPFYELELSFLCHPFRYLNEGKREISLTNGAMLHNLGNQPSLPRIQIVLEGRSDACTFRIREEGKKAQAYSFEGVEADRLIIDSETYEVTDGEGNGLYEVAKFWDFPKFPIGRFELELGSGIAAFCFMPRWCKL